MKRLIIVLLACFLLSGCWDEVLYKELTISPLAGLDGEEGNMTAYFSFPTITEENTTYSTTEGEGISLRDARNNAFTHTEEMIDVSQLEVFLISASTVKDGLYDYIDVIYRSPRTRLGGRIAIVEESVKEHFEAAQALPGNAPDFYKGLLATSIKFSYIPDYNLQQTGKLLFDKGMDIALPSLRLSKKTKQPEVSGVALFSGEKFSGHYLDLKDSRLLTALQKKGRKMNTQFTYEWQKEGKRYPITVEYSAVKRKWEITEDKIKAIYKFKFSIEEFAYGKSDKNEVIEEVESFLSKALTKDAQTVIHKLQDAKSDAVGFGQHVRAFHPNLWGKGKWQETFSEMAIEMDIKAEIVRTGILN